MLKSHSHTLSISHSLTLDILSADVVASRLAVVDDDTGLEGDGEVVVVVAVVIERERLGLSESSSDHQCVH